jgi:uncharacterized protein (TIGR01244 family)
MTGIHLDEHVLVAGQIQPSDVAGLAADGVTMIVNNRPDGEEPGQPTGAEIEAAAQAAGIGYRHVPVAGGLTALNVAAMIRELAVEDRKILAFCKSGTRSTYLWAAARAQQGADLDDLVQRAAAAGYELNVKPPASKG